jgi:multicomponent Na+:H+ antiporter subunit G
MIDTAGASLIILGMVIHAGFTLVSAKLILIGVFMFFTSPIATHALARAAHKMRVVPVGRNLDKPARKMAKKAAKTPAKPAAQQKANPKSAAAKRRPS